MDIVVLAPVEKLWNFRGAGAEREDRKKKLIEKKMVVSENSGLHQKHLRENYSCYYVFFPTRSE